MKKTYSRYAKLQGTALLIAFLICTTITFVLCLVFLWIWQIPIDTDAESYPVLVRYGVKIVMVTPVSLFIAIFASQSIGIIIGVVRDQYRLFRGRRFLKRTNPYQYYKDLPNNYGIGVNSLLSDSAIENEKDIVAALLDLCAQKYFHLSKHSDHYVIRPEPLRQNDKSPLSNEQYIIDLIKHDRLKSIDYRHWYNLCVADGVKLGLYQDAPDIDFSDQPTTKRKRFELTDIVTPKRFFIALAVVFIISIFVYYFNSGLSSPADLFLNPVSHVFDIIITFVTILIIGAMALIVFAVVAGVILAPIYCLFVIVFSAHRLSKDRANAAYKAILATRLTKTPKGIDELHKLEAFKAFLAQFNTFVDKDPEAVIIWDRYLSYAQVFGLTKEIMRSGYSQLIDNAAFKIDSINNISFDKLQVSTKHADD